MKVLCSCNCEVNCPYSVRNENLFYPSVSKRVELLEVVDGKLPLKKTHKYYRQVQAQMWVCHLTHCYFVVWTEGHKTLIEHIEIDRGFCEAIVNNLTLFYKTFVLPCLLRYRCLTQCAKCEQVILEKNKIDKPSEEGNVTCGSCGCKWHFSCAQLMEPVESWLCPGCLVDAAENGGT